MDEAQQSLPGKLKNGKVDGQIENRKVAGQTENSKVIEQTENGKVAGQNEDGKVAEQIETRKVPGQTEEDRSSVEPLPQLELTEQNIVKSKGECILSENLIEDRIFDH